MDQSSKGEKIQQTPQATTSPSRRKKLVKIKEQFHKLPDKKPHLDFLAALLSIPVLITVLILNLGSLQGKNSNVAKTTPTPIPTISSAVKTQTDSGQKVATPIVITRQTQPTMVQDQCIKDIGPIAISSPQENETVSDNPLCISIDYHSGNYCGVVWAYSINHGPLSNYSNNSVCLYNLPAGKNSFLLQVKSLVSTSTQTLQRNFVYNGATLTPTSSVTSTPTTTPAQ